MVDAANLPIEEQSLSYRGEEDGFKRVKRHPRDEDFNLRKLKMYIYVVRKRDEDDHEYVQRLEEAFEKNRNRPYQFHKNYSPEDQEFLREFYLAREQRALINASKKFDNACFDLNIYEAFGSIRILKEYFKSERSRDLDFQAKSLLRAMAVMPNHGFEDDGRGWNYSKLIYQSLDVLVRNMGNGSAKLEAMEEIFDRRERLKLEEINIYQAPASNQYEFSLERILRWGGDPVEMLECLAQRNSRFLYLGLSHAHDMIESWSREERDRERETKGLLYSFGQCANKQNGAFLPGLLRKVISSYTNTDHPQAKLFSAALEKIDSIMNSQLAEMDREIEYAKKERGRMVDFWSGKPSP